MTGCLIIVAIFFVVCIFGGVFLWFLQALGGYWELLSLLWDEHPYALLIGIAGGLMGFYYWVKSCPDPGDTKPD